MKVLLKRNVSKLGKIGDVVDVKPGYARNCLLPQGVAVAPNEANIRAIEAEKQRYLEQLAIQRKELEVQASALDGKEVTISARANEEGHLYGSVGPAQICAALAEDGTFIEPKMVRLREPIRQLDKYDVIIEFDEEITATVHVWIVPTHDPDEAAADEAAAGEPAEDAVEYDDAD